jgi:hypothetical protein
VAADDDDVGLSLREVLVGRAVDVASTERAAHPELGLAAADEFAQPALPAAFLPVVVAFRD